MTISELSKELSNYNSAFIIYLVAVPLVTFLYQYVHKRGYGIYSPHKYVYAILIYLTCIPGIFGSILTGYTLFILRGNLLHVNLFVYFLPIVSMIVTVVFMKKVVSLDRIPGFEKLWGLCVMLGITFILTLIILNTRIFLIFGGSMMTFFLVMIFLFALLKWGSYLLFRRKNEPSQKPPKFPFS